MNVPRVFSVGMAFAALTVTTACGGGDKSASSSTSTTSSPSAASSTSPSSTTSSPPPSGLAPVGDYTNLLLQPNDVGADATTIGPPVQNPGNVPGAGVTFGNTDRTRTIQDLVIVFTDTNIAAQQAKDDANSYGKYVTAPPQPFEVGTNGLIAVGTSPDNSKAVTYVTFAVGRVDVDLEFDSAPNDPAPQDVVRDIARRQEAIVKDKLPA
jgi:hypothetical protein